MAKQTRKKNSSSRRKTGAAKAAKNTAKNTGARKKPAKKKIGAPAAGAPIIITPPAAKLLLAKNPAPAAAAGIADGPTRATATPPAGTLKTARAGLPWLDISLFAGAGLILLAMLWAVGSIFFPKVQLGGRQLSVRTSDAKLAQLITADTTSYHLTVVYPDKHRQTYSLSDIGLHIDAAKTVQDIRASQHGTVQRLAWWRPIHASLHAGVTTATLRGFIAQHASIITQPAKDAHITIDNGDVRVDPGQTGKQYGLTDAASTILRAAIQMQTTPLTLTAVPLQPNVSMPALASAKTQLEAALHQKVSIAIGSQTVSPAPDDIAGWLVLTPTTTGVDVSVNTDAIHDYLAGIAHDKTAPPRNQIVDSGGAVITPGVQGAVVGSIDDAQDQIAGGLLKGAGVAVNLPASLTPFKTVQSPGSGKWIEVDLTTKHIYAYDDNTLARSFLVSAGAPATPTVTGRFAIYSKYRSQDMTGENADGSNYFQPAVPYVNYFYRDYAIHGNYWRPSSYFGNINSSHGCVGINVSDGAWMYSWAPIGTPVITHY